MRTGEYMQTVASFLSHQKPWHPCLFHRTSARHSWNQAKGSFDSGQVIGNRPGPATLSQLDLREALFARADFCGGVLARSLL